MDQVVLKAFPGLHDSSSAPGAVPAQSEPGYRVPGGFRELHPRAAPLTEQARAALESRPTPASRQVCRSRACPHLEHSAQLSEKESGSASASHPCHDSDSATTPPGAEWDTGAPSFLSSHPGFLLQLPLHFQRGHQSTGPTRSRISLVPGKQGALSPQMQWIPVGRDVRVKSIKPHVTEPFTPEPIFLYKGLIHFTLTLATFPFFCQWTSVQISVMKDVHYSIQYLFRYELLDIISQQPLFVDGSCQGAAGGVRDDSITAIVNSFNLLFPSTMSRSTLLLICVAFCSILFLTWTPGCQAFPKVERRETAHASAEKEQTQKMNTDDQENISFAPKYMPQQMSSEVPMVLSAGPSVTPLHKVFSVNKESQLPGAGLLHPTSPGIDSPSEPVVSASEQEHGPSQLERMSPEHSLSRAMFTVAVSSPASLNPDQGGPYSNLSTQPIVEAVTDGTHGFLEYVDNQLFATESQEAVSLGNLPSSSVNTKEPEKIRADAARITTAFPGVDSTRDTEPDRKRPSEMATDDAQTTTTKYLVTVPKNVLTIEPTAGRILEDPKVTVSATTPGPVSSVFSEEWDDTKFESISRGMPPEPGDNAETQVRTEPPHGTYGSFEETKESPTSTEVTKVAPGLPGGETALGTALETALGDERSTVFSYQISFPPTSLAEDPEVSTMKLISSAGGFTASTQGDRTQLSSETAVSTSQYEPVSQQEAGNVVKVMRRM
uniref:armadillo-like helical domain-containing protein 4 n=1 Tax=Arvicanthis niloticus TaxID=61156 RepID=UPI001485D83D|nr:armadillo-like helical domain-containing protein 4 [Arvicanthis niloticus]